MWQHLYLVSLATWVTALPTQSSSSSGSIHLTSRRRAIVSESGRVLPEVLTVFNNTLKKYNVGSYIAPYPGLDGTLSRRQSPVPLVDQCANGGNDLLYYGPIKIRDKTFTIDFDTGSADFFVPGSACGTQQGCAGSSKYDGAGRDLGNTTSVTYGSGAVTGKNYLDTVTVGNLTATDTNVIALLQAKGFSNSQSDGLMGMAFSKLANAKQPTFVERLIAENKISSKEFCFYLGRCSDNSGSTSEMTIGGRNPSKFTGTFTTVPLKKQDYWRVAIDGVKAGDIPVAIPGDAIIDTGTTAVVASPAYAVPINEAIGGIPVPLGSTGSLELIAYAIPCDSKTQIALTFAGQDLVMNSKDMTIGTIDISFATLLNHAPLISRVKAAEANPSAVLCLSSILQADVGVTMNPPVANFNIIGDSFLKNWYSCFSYNGASGQPGVLFAKSI
ncbi:acid protease [Lindgomyces ingoldianus]|uniref:Acid protease n=1 Tax=Lindgomyces ingoldianus TaxID=673940 RepID=A0ACB6QNH6_9PLEO|nr:acid protease [Lindgomyces ingoldianus]KAF2468128.1 acid protease [Lindgomyces ingoldianus]